MHCDGENLILSWLIVKFNVHCQIIKVAGEMVFWRVKSKDVCSLYQHVYLHCSGTLGNEVQLYPISRWHLEMLIIKNISSDGL